MKEKVLVAMSGGVDSSVAALLMKEKGFECSGVTFNLYPKPEGEGEEVFAAEAAEKLGIGHHTLDLKERFKEKVITPFIETYEKGATPNPCIYCNRSIKFALSLFRSMGLEFNLYATGHYAQVEKSGERWLLKKAADSKKDQSYVLYSLGQKILSLVHFPLGKLTKSEVREIARENSLSSFNKKESQDICFVSTDHGAFIEQFTGRHYPPGEILNTEGKPIGRHKGIIRYTLGQRRGLGVALNKPLYVSAINAALNTVTLGGESSLFSKTLTASRINLIAQENLEKPLKVKVKTRYMQQEHPAVAMQTGPDEFRLEFDEAQRAITPGQAAVLYDGDIVIGGGIIN